MAKIVLKTFTYIYFIILIRILTLAANRGYFELLFVGCLERIREEATSQNYARLCVNDDRFRRGMTDSGEEEKDDSKPSADGRGLLYLFCGELNSRTGNKQGMDSATDDVRDRHHIWAELKSTIRNVL